MNGREIIGSYKPDMLIAGTRYPVDVCHVILGEKRQHQKGEVLAPKDGKYYVLGTEEAASAEYILAETIVTEDEATVAVAYKAGEFVTSSLITLEGYTMTEGDIKALRYGNIHLMEKFK